MTTRFAQRFVLEREVGAGGMARVFLGRDAVLERPVAIKILKPGHDETDISARFRREGRTAAKLSHPNIVQVYDAGEDEFEGRKTSYIVMEYVPGGDLKDLLDARGRLSNEELARLGVGIAAGLSHAHEKGVVHRDVKPHNVLLDDRERPKLSDFGIARALDATQATRTGSYLGTALYSSPEQLRGEKVTPKSDVYSLGVMFYQAATGETPFAGSPITVAHRHVSEAPTPPRKLDGTVSEDLDALILDCMRKKPEARPTADEVRIRLLEAGRGTYPTRVQPAPAPEASEPAQPLAPEPRPTRAPQSAAGPSAPPPNRERRAEPRRGFPAALLAVAALLVVALLGVAAYAMLGGDDGSDTASNTPSGQSDGGGNQSEQASREPQPRAQGTQGTQGAAQAGDEQAQGGAANPSEDAGGLSAGAAEQTLRDFYSSAADGDYGAAADLLSTNFRQTTFPDEGTLAGTFNTLESIEWIEGPTATVDGDTATVAGTDIATHTDRTERVTGTWSMVNEGGEWKIDGINIVENTEI